MRPEVEKFFQLTQAYPSNKTGIKEAYQDGWDRAVAECLDMGAFRGEAEDVVKALRKEAFLEGIRQAKEECPEPLSPSTINFMTIFLFMVNNKVSPDQAAKSAAWAVSSITPTPEP